MISSLSLSASLEERGQWASVFPLWFSLSVSLSFSLEGREACSLPLLVEEEGKGQCWHRAKLCVSLSKRGGQRARLSPLLVLERKAEEEGGRRSLSSFV